MENFAESTIEQVKTKKDTNRMNYIEAYDVTAAFREDYRDGLDRLIEKREREAEKIRAEYIKDIFTTPEKYRDELKKLFGWPLVDFQAEGLPEVVMCEKLAEDDTHTAYRMRFKIFDELTLTGIFFKAKEEGKKPLVICQHGGLGTPEMISEFYEIRANYNGMLQMVTKRGVHAFAPQLLLWNRERYGVEYDRKIIDARLKRTGSSITAVEIFAITRVLDYFEAQDYVKNFGMVGLSYGGFYTLMTTAVETRIKSAVSCSFFNTREKVSWTDWTWDNLAYKFDDAEIACLVYPRNLCIEVGDKDALFDYKEAIKSFDKLKLLCKNVGTDWVDFVVFDGIHEFCKDDTPIEKMVNELKEN